jgi:hypothetical protein
MVHVGDSCAGELKPFRATFRLSQPRSHCKLLAGSDAEPKPVRQRLFTRVDIHMTGADGTWHTTPDQPGACRRPRATSSRSVQPGNVRVAAVRPHDDVALVGNAVAADATPPSISTPAVAEPEHAELWTVNAPHRGGDWRRVRTAARAGLSADRR